MSSTPRRWGSDRLVPAIVIDDAQRAFQGSEWGQLTCSPPPRAKQYGRENLKFFPAEASAGVAIIVSGSWMASRPMIAEADFNTITQLRRASVDQVS